MNRILKVKIITDIGMTFLLLFLMPYELLGEAVHEWIGMAMFAALLLHHFLNRKWLGNLLKGKYNAYRILQTISVFAVLLCMLGSMASGMILSRHVFAFLNIRGGTGLARTVHMTSAYWGFVLMGVHLGLHWNMVVVMAGRLFKTRSAIRKWAARIAAFGIFGYGIYAFVKHDVGSYMLQRVQFAFFDYEEPLAFFILDYMAVMALFAGMGYYLSKWLRCKK